MTITVREAVASYGTHIRTLGLAPEYIRCQESYLARFAAACGGIQVRSLTPRHIASFYEELPNTRASHNRALTALKSFTRYLERMKDVKPGTTDFLLGDRKTKKFTRKPKYYVPPSQFGPMIQAAAERHPVDRATLALAFYTLGRQGEIANLKFKDLGWDARMLNAETIRIYRPKRKRWTIVQVSPDLRIEINVWIDWYAGELGLPPARLIRDHPDWYLVPNLECIRVKNGRGQYDPKLTEYRLIPDQPALRLERLVKRMLDIFGAQTEDGKHVRHMGEGMHTIRRSGARAMIDHLATVWGEDKALLMVSTMLDHETTTMTLLYIGRSLEQKRLNAFLESNSMYGDHGRAMPEDSNVTRLPVRAAASETGEVDAL